MVSLTELRLQRAGLALPSPPPTSSSSSRLASSPLPPLKRVVLPGPTKRPAPFEQAELPKERQWTPKKARRTADEMAIPRRTKETSAAAEPTKLTSARQNLLDLYGRVAHAKFLARLYPPPSRSIYALITTSSRTIPARDRIFHCPPPPGCPTRFERDLSFSQTARAKRAAVAAAAGTDYYARIGYALKDYHTWAELHEVEDGKRMPMRPDILEMYLASLAGFVSAKLLRGRVLSLRRWHIHHRVNWDIKDEDVEVVLRGAKQVEPYAKVKREPLLRNDLEKLVSHLDPTSPFDACWLAATTIAHRSCLRSGEFTVPSQQASRPEFHATMKNLKVTSVDGKAVGVTLHLPRDKVNGLLGADVHFSSIPSSTVCPISSLLNHLSSNRIEEDDFLFSFISAQGRSKGKKLRMTKSAWRDRLHELLKLAKLPPLEGHTVRIGGATQLLLDGVDPLVVKVIGRWRSDAFECYWRNVGAILSKFASKAKSSSQEVKETALADEEFRNELRAMAEENVE